MALAAPATYKEPQGTLKEPQRYPKGTPGNPKEPQVTLGKLRKAKLNWRKQKFWDDSEEEETEEDTEEMNLLISRAALATPAAKNNRNKAFFLPQFFWLV